MIMVQDLIFYMGDTKWFRGIYDISNFVTVYRENSGNLISHSYPCSEGEHHTQVRIQHGWRHLSDFFTDRNSLLVESHEYSTFSMLFGEQNTKELIFMYLKMEKYLQQRG